MRRVTVKVKPQAKTARLITDEGDSWIAHVKAPPIDGKANDALIELIAETLRIRRSAVTMVSGHTARTKRLEIHDD